MASKASPINLIFLSLIHKTAPSLSVDPATTIILSLKLLSKKGGGLSYAKVGAYASAGLSLTETQQEIEDEGQDLGLPSDEIARLQAEAADMWKDFDTTQFKPNVKDGGLMRVNLAMGTKGKPRPGEIFEDSGLEFPVIDSVPPSVGNKAQVVDPDVLRQMFMEALKNGEIPPLNKSGWGGA